MSKLYLKDFFAKVPVPESLKGQVVDSNNQPREYIEPLSKINIFVGPNNSGKSYLLRELIKSELAPVHMNSQLLNQVVQLLEETHRQFVDILVENGLLNSEDQEYVFVTSLGELRGDYIKSEQINQAFSINSYSQHLLQTLSNSGDIKRKLETVDQIHYPSSSDGEYRELGKNVQIALYNLFENLGRDIFPYLYPRNSEEYKIAHIYIHYLRTAFQSALSNEEIITNLPKKYEFPKNLMCETGADLYNKIRNADDETESKEKLEKYCEFLSAKFFSNEKVRIASSQKNNEITLKIGSEEARSIYNIGTGLQMILILTWPLFNYERGIIVVEEPELFIHPGMQKQLMQIYSSHERAENFVFFIATHSNHIIDSISYSENLNDFSVFSVRKVYRTAEKAMPQFVVENLAYGDQNALHLLGVTNTSVYLANCTVWVEGVTDRLYLQKYIEVFFRHLQPDKKIDLDKLKEEYPKDELELYARCLSYKEGVHYAFVYSGGDSIIHWDFSTEASLSELSKDVRVKALCGRAMVVVDSDFNKNQKRKKTLEEILGAQFVVLPVPEVENLLSLESVVKAVQAYSSRSEWSGPDISIHADLEQKLKSVKLGTFIDRELLQNNESGKTFAKKSKKSSHLEKGVTIKEKVKFCEKARKHITYETMTAEAKDLVKKVLKFIDEQNNK